MKKTALILTDGPGGNGFVRMNIATTKDKLETALSNLKKAYKAKF